MNAFYWQGMHFSYFRNVERYLFFCLLWIYLWQCHSYLVSYFFPLTLPTEEVSSYLFLNRLRSIMIQVCVSHAAGELPFIIFIWWHFRNGSSTSHAHSRIQFIDALILSYNGSLLGLLHRNIGLAIDTHWGFVGREQRGCWLFILGY